ncbi:MAG: hypothetical protein WCC64_08490 [Aliidongia sp.]
MMKWVVIGLIGICLAGNIGSAIGQGIVTEPNAIIGCLCQEQGIDLLRSRLSDAQRVFDEDRRQIDALDRQLDQARATINVASQSQVDAVKALNLEREALYAQTYDVDAAALRRATDRYNRLAGQYGAQCANRYFDSIQMTQYRAHLSCPVSPTPNSFDQEPR